MIDIISVENFEELKARLARDHNLQYLGLNADQASNTLYSFGTDKQTHIVKQVSDESTEVKNYIEHLPIVRNNYLFSKLEIPVLIDCYISSEKKCFLLLPYFKDGHNDFVTADLELAKGMAEITKELSQIDIDQIYGRTTSYDFQSNQERFSIHLSEATNLGLISADEIQNIETQANIVLKNGEVEQQLIFSNGDFNPRNVIKRNNGTFVLVDWDGMPAALEKHLTYPWSINIDQSEWRQAYAQEFERLLPVKKERVRYHLLIDSLTRAVIEMRNFIQSGNPFPKHMADSLMNDFRKSLRGFDSLTELN